MAQRPLADVGIDRPRWLAEQPLDVVAEWLVDVLVALVTEGVGQRLVGRDSVDRGRHRRIAHLLADEEQLLQQPIVSIDGVALTEVTDQDRQDRGGQLVLQHEDIVAKGDWVLELEVFVVDLVEVAAGLADQIDVEPGVVGPVPKTGHHRLGGGLRGAPGQGREGRIDAGRPRLNRREV